MTFFGQFSEKVLPPTPPAPPSLCVLCNKIQKGECGFHLTLTIEFDNRGHCHLQLHGYFLNFTIFQLLRKYMLIFQHICIKDSFRRVLILFLTVF